MGFGMRIEGRGEIEIFVSAGYQRKNKLCAGMSKNVVQWCLWSQNIKRSTIGMSKRHF